MIEHIGYILIGVAIGIFIGGIIRFLAFTLCKAGAEVDQRMQNTYYQDKNWRENE